MSAAISVVDLSRRHGRQLVLDRVTFDVAAGSISGLLGRNGAGKTTLLRILAGQEFASAGNVAMLGGSPAENAAVLRRIALIREDRVHPDISVRVALALASRARPNWSGEVAAA